MTSERAGERRLELISAALEVFGDRDYDEVSVDEVAEAAGVSHGLVFRYFGSKKGLYVACLTPLIDAFRARIEPDPELPPIERLREGLRNFADAISEHPAGYRNLMTRGVSFTEDPQERPYGIDCGFRDPSGNSIRLTQVTMAGVSQ